MQRLDPQIKLIWTFKSLIRWLGISIFLLIIEFLLSSNGVKLPLIMGLHSLTLFSFGFILSLIGPQLQYRAFKFDFRENELYIERGIFTRIKTIAPFSRVQHLDVSQTILQRMSNLSSLIIYTAGTRGADLMIPGLTTEYAEYLRDLLKNSIESDEV